MTKAERKKKKKDWLKGKLVRNMSEKAVKEVLTDEIKYDVKDSLRTAFPDKMHDIIMAALNSSELKDYISTTILDKMIKTATELILYDYVDSFASLGNGYIEFDYQPDYIEHGENAEWNFSITQLCREHYDDWDESLDKTIEAFKNGLAILEEKREDLRKKESNVRKDKEDDES